MTPLVSIVMAAKDYGRFIESAIGSVQAQTFEQWELIIVDDGSIDRTPKLVRRFLKDERICYHRADRLGQSRAKNLGISFCRGDYIAFLDADDLWEPTKLTKQLPLFRPSIDVVYSLRSLIDERGKPLVSKPYQPHRGEIRDLLFVQNFICFSSAVVRRSLFDRVGRFDESIDLAIDYDFWLRAATATQFDFVNESLVKYRTGHANLSRRLDDRVQIACSIMERATRRGGFARSAIAEGYASTCRTLAYVLRNSRPLDSVAWSWRALAWPHRRWQSIKGIVGTLFARFRPAVS